MVRYCQCNMALTDAAPASSKPPYQTLKSVQYEQIICKWIHRHTQMEIYFQTWKPGRSGMTIITLKHFLSLYARMIRRNNASKTRFRIISSPERPDMKN